MSANHEEKNTAPQGANIHVQTYDGKIVSVTGDKLMMKNHLEVDCSHTLAKDAMFTRDGVQCNVADLKVGSRGRVTTKNDDRNTVTGVETLDHHTEFA